jgi:RNA polymerase sigma factor for flagellar operon FliA
MVNNGSGSPSTRRRPQGSATAPQSEGAALEALDPSPRPEVERYLPLVEQIVVQVAVNFPRHVDRAELVRAGVLGLVEAAHRYDAVRGVPFDRFAARRIRGAILDAVRSSDWAPRSVRAMSRRVDAAEQRLASELGRVPSIEEMSESLGVSVGDLNALRDRVFRSVVLALDYRLGDEEEDLSLVDVLCDRTAAEPAEELEGREVRSYLRDAVGLLPERHRIVIVGYFLEGRTSEELADLLGVTESRISQLRSEALLMLREGIEAQFVEQEASEKVSGRVARRKATYAAAIGAQSTWRRRLERAAGQDPASARIRLEA